jgi:hypothetical protein
MLTVAERDVVVPLSARRLVWVVDHWDPGVPRPPALRDRPLARGRWLYVLELDRQPLLYAGYRLTPLTALARLR